MAFLLEKTVNYKIIAHLRGAENIECPEHGIRLSHRGPIYTLCRRLNELGLGYKTLSVIAANGTPSCKINIAKGAGLTVEARVRGGLKLRKYRPFPGERIGRTARSPVSEGGRHQRRGRRARCGLGPAPCYSIEVTDEASALLEAPKVWRRRGRVAA